MRTTLTVPRFASFGFLLHLTYRTNAGTFNIGLRCLFLVGLMVYGFVLIYLRDFAPGKESWIAGSLTGPPFESRLAHAHGNLFAFLNIAIGSLLLRFAMSDTTKKYVSLVALVGMLMPLGILAGLLLGAPPLFVLTGALLMTVAVLWLGIEVLTLHLT